jgi:hypothetical protein
MLWWEEGETGGEGSGQRERGEREGERGRGGREKGERGGKWAEAGRVVQGEGREKGAKERSEGEGGEVECDSQCQHKITPVGLNSLSFPKLTALYSATKKVFSRKPKIMTASTQNCSRTRSLKEHSIITIQAMAKMVYTDVIIP